MESIIVRHLMPVYHVMQVIQTSSQGRGTEQTDSEGDALRRRALQAELRETRKRLQQEQTERVKLEAELAEVRKSVDDTKDREIVASV